MASPLIFSILSKYDKTGVTDALSSFRTLQREAISIRRALFGAFSIAALASFVVKSQEVTIQTRRLAQDLKNLGIAGAQQAQNFRKLAEGIQSSTGIPAKETISGIREYVNILKDSLGAEEAAKAARTVSIATGAKTEQVITAVAEAYKGNTKALEELTGQTEATILALAETGQIASFLDKQFREAAAVGLTSFGNKMRLLGEGAKFWAGQTVKGILTITNFFIPGLKQADAALESFLKKRSQLKFPGDTKAQPELAADTALLRGATTGRFEALEKIQRAELELKRTKFIPQSLILASEASKRENEEKLRNIKQVVNQEIEIVQQGARLKAALLLKSGKATSDQLLLIEKNAQLEIQKIRENAELKTELRKTVDIALLTEDEKVEAEEKAKQLIEIEKKARQKGIANLTADEKLFIRENQLQEALLEEADRGPRIKTGKDERILKDLQETLKKVEPLEVPVDFLIQDENLIRLANELAVKLKKALDTASSNAVTEKQNKQVTTGAEA